MKKTSRRLASLAMALAVGVSTGANVFAADVENNLEYIVAPYNSDITNGIVRDASVVNDLDNTAATTQDITLSLNQENDDIYIATGELKTNADVYTYTVAGKLETVMTAGGEGVIGFMTGELENGEHLGMNLHHIIGTDKVFVYATIGYITENNDCKTFVFGSTFEEMNELVEEYVEQQPGEEDTASSAADNQPVSLAAADYNVSYRGMGIQQGQLINGNRVDLIATTLYTPKRMGPNEIAKGYVKVNGHTGNAKIYVQGTKLVPGVMSVWASSGTCSISSPKDNYMEMSNMDPGNESWGVELPIPYYAGGAWGLLPWNINIGFSTIKTSLSKNKGSVLYNNIAKWSHNYTGDVNWGANGAPATKKGYSGCCSMSYQKNRSYNYTTSVTGSGTINYNYRSQYGVTQYTGNFTAASSVSANIVIDKR